MEKLATTPPTNSFFLRVSLDWVNLAHAKTEKMEMCYEYIKIMQNSCVETFGDDFFREVVSTNVRPRQGEDNQMKHDLFPGNLFKN